MKFFKFIILLLIFILNNPDIQGSNLIPLSFSYVKNDVEFTFILEDDNECHEYSEFGSNEGKYFINYDACFIDIPSRYPYGTFGVVRDNTFYVIATEIWDENYAQNLNNVSFDPNTLTITFYHDDNKRSVKLNEIPVNQKYEITPLNGYDPVSSSGSDIAFIKDENDGIMYLKRDGVFEVKPHLNRNGTWSLLNGIYYIDYGAGLYGDSQFAIIYNDHMYDIITSWYDDEDFWDYLGNHGIANTVSFDKSSETVIYKTTSGIKKKKLTNIPQSNRRKVNWTNP